MAALENQPVNVAIHASQEFMQYSKGVFDQKNCRGPLNHSMTAVGYGAGYFIVRNSWGTEWGEEGYIRISSETLFGEPAGICGILSELSRPYVY